MAAIKVRVPISHRKTTAPWGSTQISGRLCQEARARNPSCTSFQPSQERVARELERLCHQSLTRGAAAPALGTPMGGGSRREDRFLRPALQMGGARHPTPTPLTPSQPFHPAAQIPPPIPSGPGHPCHPDSQPTLRASGRGHRRGGSSAPKGGPELGGRRTPTRGTARRRETTQPGPGAEAAGGGGRRQAAKGRYLVAVAVVLLHGGADSPGGGATGRAPRPRTGLRGGPTPKCIRAHRRRLPAASYISGNRVLVLSSWQLCQCESDGVTKCASA